MLQEGEGDAVREVGEAAGGEGVADVPHLLDRPHHGLGGAEVVEQEGDLGVLDRLRLGDLEIVVLGIVDPLVLSTG